MSSSTAVRPSTAIRSFNDLRLRAQALGPKRVAIVVADDEIALLAASGAVQLGIAIPVLIGNEHKMRAEIATSVCIRSLIAQSSSTPQIRSAPTPAPRWRATARSISF